MLSEAKVQSSVVGRTRTSGAVSSSLPANDTCATFTGPLGGSQAKANPTGLLTTWGGPPGTPGS